MHRSNSIILPPLPNSIVTSCLFLIGLFYNSNILTSPYVPLSRFKMISAQARLKKMSNSNDRRYKQGFKNVDFGS